MRIGSTIQLNGEKEYRQRLKDITRQTKLLQSEMKRTTSAFDKNTSAEEKQRKQTDLLEKQTADYNAEIKNLNELIRSASAQFGENSRIVTQLKTELNNTQAALNNTSKGLRETDRAAEGAAESTSSFGDMLKAKLTGEAIIAGVTKLVQLFADLANRAIDAGRNAAAFADDILTLSTTTGLSTDTLQEFKYMEGLIDVDLGTITGSLTKLTRNMSTAAKGTGDAAKAFDRLGVSITDEATGALRDNEAVFYDVIDALGQIENETERDRLSMRIFGKSRQRLNPLIAQGSRGLARFAQEAHDVGYVMGEDMLGSLGRAQDSFDRWSRSTEAIKNQIGAEMRPVLQEFYTHMLEIAQGVDWQAVGRVVSTVAGGILLMIKDMIAFVGAFITAIKTIVDAVQYVAETLPTWWQNVVQGVVDMKDRIKEKIDQLIESAKEWGRDFIEGFKKGIERKISDVLTSIRNMASGIKSLVHFSRPDEGPLRDYESWPRDFMEGYARGIEANEWRIRDAMNGVAQTMALNVNGSPAVAGYGGRGGVVINFYGDINADGQGTGEAIIAEINEALGRRLG